MDGVSAQTAAKFAVALFKEAKDQGLLNRLLTRLKRKPRILLLGCTGTGKTNFLSSLTATAAPAIRREDRTQWTEAKNLLLDDKAYRFIDTPGDVERDEDRNQAIREAVAAKGGIAGVINLVCYGYHEYDLSRDDVFESDAKLKPDYLELHRKEEINQLAEWTELLGDKTTVGWLITVVNKADLWWDHRDAVLKHYSSGEYYHALHSAKTLNPRVMPYSSVFHKFYSTVPMSGTFDQDDRAMYRSNLLAALVKALLKKQGD